MKKQNVLEKWQDQGFEKSITIRGEAQAIFDSLNRDRVFSEVLFEDDLSSSKSIQFVAERIDTPLEFMVENAYNYAVKALEKGLVSNEISKLIAATTPTGYKAIAFQIRVEPEYKEYSREQLSEINN